MGRPPTKPAPTVGAIYKKLTVVENPQKLVLKSKWLCRCQCGRLTWILGNNLVAGRSESCGICYKIGPTNRLGMLPKLYDKLGGAARSAIKRCMDKNHPRYKDWGGRGIEVYLSWKNDYVEFVVYLATLGGCDNPNLVLDRIDNNRGYVPGNLRFVTPKQSAANRRAKKPKLYRS